MKRPFHAWSGISKSARGAGGKAGEGESEVIAAHPPSLPPARSRTLLLASLACLLPAGASAAIPALENVFPPGGQAGSAFTVTATGRFDPWPVKIWIDCPGVEFMSTTNAGQFAVTIAKDAPIGPHFVRAHNADGVSEPRPFVIGRYAEVADKEPNDHFKQAQPLAALPAVVNGKLEKRGDVDTFAVRAEAGRWLVARLDGYALGSPMDPFLHLLDERGAKLAYSADSHNLDPVLAFRIERPGTYHLQVSAFVYPPAADVQLAGSASCVYRLTISDAPMAFGSLPAGAQRGRKSTVQLLGWNLAAASAARDVDATGAPPLADATRLQPDCAERSLPVLLGDFPELVESEPNNTATNAQTVEVPCFVSGRIERPGDEDRFAFSAKKGERFNFRVNGDALGSQLDAWVRVEDAAGKQLAFADDATTSVHDPVLAWTAPADGRYVVAIGDLFRKGAPEFRYRLSLTPPRADFRVTADAHSYGVGRGLTNTIKLTVTQLEGGFTNLVASVAGLPAGVTVAPVDVPAKGGEVKLVLAAGEMATLGGVPIQALVTVRDSVPPRARAATFNLKTGPIPGDLLLNQIDQFWLTVTPGTPPPAPPAKKKR